MSNNSESTEARLDRIERVTGLQQALIDRLSVAVIAQHGILTGLAEAVGVELETQQPAPRAPLTSLN